jgi:hypothetical protein
VADAKPKETTSLRTPKAKKTLGLSVPPALRMPHEDLIHPEITAVPEYRGTGVPQPENIVDQQQVSDGLPQYSGTAVPNVSNISIPESRFYRKPNEASDALDRHLSAAESKVFDQLYRLIHGFNLPERQIRIEVLRQRTGYNSDKTIRTALAGLEAKGIISRSGHRNSPGGEVYRILSYSGTGVPEYRSTAAENTSVLESKFTGQLNTTLKDKINDDEAFAEFLTLLKQANREVTGRETSASESGRWRELAELLVTELKIAAGRTGSVSSVPAFLTEHLHRRLWKKDKRQVEVEASERSEGDALKVDASQCPDCFGTGMYYPEGFDKGVARCGHEKLMKAD